MAGWRVALKKSAPYAVSPSSANCPLVRLAPALKESLVPLGTEKRATASSCFARKAAFGIGKIELSERTQYGIGGNARLTVAARGFAVDLGGQGIADAVTQRAGGGGVGLVFCGTDAVIAADVACFKRPFVQAFAKSPLLP